jgi:uncharacterized protein YjbI with pentapeptide repeats
MSRTISARRPQQAAHDLLISNQVSKGFEQLASDKIAMRLGGIYALEGVMNTSEQYHGPVLEGLCAFVRENTIGKTAPEEPATDVQAALTVIGRRKQGPGEIDLVSVSIPEANLIKASLINANLFKANLFKASLVNANLSGANLHYANLSGAYLLDANLSNANLSEANLSGAHLGVANLSGADLFKASLINANLSGADLSDAKLRDANLSGADLSEAHGLSQTQLDEACGDANTKLPEGLKPPKPCQGIPVPPPRVP